MSISNPWPEKSLRMCDVNQSSKREFEALLFFDSKGRGNNADKNNVDRGRE
jgi:hypothetical protein